MVLECVYQTVDRVPRLEEQENKADKCFYVSQDERCGATDPFLGPAMPRTALDKERRVVQSRQMCGWWLQRSVCGEGHMPSRGSDLREQVA